MNLLKYIFGNKNFDIDVNVQTTSGKTLLHVACYHGQFEVVKFLLENSKQKGIDVTKMDNLQHTAEDLARHKGDILELFRVIK